MWWKPISTTYKSNGHCEAIEQRSRWHRQPPVLHFYACDVESSNKSRCSLGECFLLLSFSSKFIRVFVHCTWFWFVLLLLLNVSHNVSLSIRFWSRLFDIICIVCACVNICKVYIYRSRRWMNRGKTTATMKSSKKPEKNTPAAIQIDTRMGWIGDLKKTKKHEFFVTRLNDISTLCKSKCVTFWQPFQHINRHSHIYWPANGKQWA